MAFVPSHMRMKSQQTQQHSNEVQVTEHSQKQQQQQQVVEQPAINNQDIQENSYGNETDFETS